MEKIGSGDELESDWQLTLRRFYMVSHIHLNPKLLLVQFLKIRYLFKKFLKSFFDHENIKKKLTSKVAYLWQFGFFFSAAPTAQNSPD